MRIIPILFPFLALFMCCLVNGQNLHHQMLGAQGSANRIKSGHFISQSVGQQSIIGSRLNAEFRVSQGFQQVTWFKLSRESVLPKHLLVKAYPNPFVDKVGFSFSQSLIGTIHVLVFDTSGMLVDEISLTLANNYLELQLSHLPPAMYLVHLKHKDLTSYMKIIKK